jgi:hypothetical protein
MESAEIGNIGERFATMELASKGFECRRNTQFPGSTDIEGRQNGFLRLLVQVKTAVFPAQAAYLSSEESSGIVSRANRNNCQAWLAQVQINNLGGLVGAISWTKLS